MVEICQMSLKIVPGDPINDKPDCSDNGLGPNRVMMA